MSRLVRRLQRVFRVQRTDDDLVQEIETHRTLLQQDLQRRGLTPEAAETESRRALGNIALAREDARSVWAWHWIESTAQDARLAIRGLRRAPGFTAVALLTLALGIGMTTAMFSVIEAVLLRPLPYDAPDRLAMVWTHDLKRGVREQPTSYLTFADWKSHTRQFSDLAIFQGEPVIVSGPNGAERVLAQIVSANLFPLLGVTPAAGRTFSIQEEANAEPVVVISHGLWQRQFGGSADVIGSTIHVRAGRVGEQRCRILGVMPATFYFPNKDVQLWRPTLSAYVSGAAAKWMTEPRFRFTVNDWSVIGRLKSNATITEAQAEMTDVGRALAGVHAVDAQRVPAFAGFGVSVVPLLDQLTGTGLRRALWLLFGAVAVVLLITCVNVASLLLARGAGRAREFAIRSALGAGRFRLMRQSLTESIALAVVAAALGLFLANAGIRALSLYAPVGVYPSASTSYVLTDSVRVPVRSAQPGIPRLDELRIDRRIVLFATGLSMVAVIFFGLAPSRRLATSSPREALQQGGRNLAGSRSLSRARQFLVAVECALAVLLLVGAGLLIRTLARLDQVDPGFSTRHVLLMRVSLAPTTQDPRVPAPDNVERRRIFYEQVRARLFSEPGVESAGLITDFFSRAVVTEPVIGPDRLTQAVGDVWRSSVDSGFFKTVGVPLLRGRFFTDADTQMALRLNRTDLTVLARTNAASPAIVNGLLAEKLFPGGDPIGQRFGIGPPGRVFWYEVLGVVGNMRRDGLDRPPGAEYYTPYVGQTSELAVRTSGDPSAAASAIRDAIRSVDPNGIVMSTTTLEDKLAELDATRQLQARLLTLFAGLSLFLAAIGIYGTVRYVVAQRTQEMGVRIALGARPANLIALVIRQGMTAPFIGLTIGLLGALAGTRVLAHVLYETSPTDLQTLAAVVITLLVSALCACGLPALRAARTDPVAALR